MPAPCGGHTACERGGKLYVFGGGSGTQYVSALHVFDLHASRWLQVRVSGTAPQPRSRHTAAFVGAHMFVLFGGDDTRVYDDVHVFDADASAWRELATTGDKPGARWGHSMCVLPDSRLLVFGGHDGENMLNDLHILDTQTRVWTRLHTAPGDSRVPPPRAGHTASMVDRLMIVFGGGDGDSLLNDTWSLTLDGDDTPHWNRLVASGAPPSARCAHTSISLPAEKPLAAAHDPQHCCRVLVFGGGDGARRFKDVYVLDVHRLVGAVPLMTPPAASVQASADAPAAVATVSASTSATTAVGESSSHDSPATLARLQSGKARHSESLRRHDAGAGAATPAPPSLRAFLERIGLAQFHDALAAQDVDVGVLPTLTEAHLRDLGVGTIGARLRIMAAAKDLASITPSPKRVLDHHVDHHALLDAARALDSAMRVLSTAMSQQNQTAIAAAAHTASSTANQLRLAAGGSSSNARPQQPQHQQPQQQQQHVTSTATSKGSGGAPNKQQFSPKKNGKH